MVVDHLILALLWIAYGVLHSVLASLPVKRRLQLRLGTRYRFYRVFYTVFAFLGLAAVLYYQVTIISPMLFTQTLFTRIAGSVVSFSGLALMLVCIRKYFFSLSGLRSLFVEGSRPQLIISGVHRYVRHPLYLGTFAFIWGLFLLWPQLSLLVADTVITLYTLVGIGLEEEKLMVEFGDDYRSYRRSVPKLWPLARPRREFP